MKKFNSPVYPIPPSFNKNEDLDLTSTIKYLTFLQKNNSKVIMTTAGTSQYNLMTKEEIRTFNLSIVNNFKGEKILGLPLLSLKHLLEEVIYLNTSIKDYKNNSLLILFPERYYDDKQIIDYFTEICSTSNFPVLVHGNILKKGIGGSYEYSKPLLEKLQQIPNFIGIKEEASNIMHSTDNLPLGLEVIVAGGSMKRFWALEPHGATTYLAGVGSFNPKLEELFFKNYFNNKNKSRDIIEYVEKPLFNIFMALGWHLSMRTALKIMGIIDYDRNPFKQISKSNKILINQSLNILNSYE